MINFKFSQNMTCGYLLLIPRTRSRSRFPSEQSKMVQHLGKMPISYNIWVIIGNHKWEIANNRITLPTRKPRKQEFSKARHKRYPCVYRSYGTNRFMCGLTIFYTQKKQEVLRKALPSLKMRKYFQHTVKYQIF